MAKLFMRSHEMGQIKEGNYADCLVVDGDPLKDITILQDHDKLNIIMINGRVHKEDLRSLFYQFRIPRAYTPRRMRCFRWSDNPPSRHD